MAYKEFGIMDVAERCGIQFNSRTLNRTNVEAWCPFCPTQSSSCHMYLNTKNDKFYCQKCGTGGNSLTLYAKIHGVDNSEAYERLSSGLICEIPRRKEAEKPKTPGYAPAPLNRRHDVYYDMLGMMRLSGTHCQDLLNRGLPLQRIQRNMYRSMPENFYARRRIAEGLAQCHDLRGVPGFYYSKYGHWELWGKPGLLVPVCDRQGYIQGLQIRLDGASKKKYRWLSSNPEYNFPHGTASSVWIHVTGSRKSREAYITEGGLKGDVASYLSGDSLFVCTAGATSIMYLSDVLRSLGVAKVNGCFDMDQVAALEKLMRLREDPLNVEAVKPCPLERMEMVAARLGLEYERRIWTPELNGIDNYYLDCLTRQRQAG